MDPVLPGVHATAEARSAIELSEAELAALTATAESDAAAEAPAAGSPAEEPAEPEKAPEAPPAHAAPAKPTRTVSAEVLPDAQALALAATVFPGREFKDANAARTSLQGMLSGNAGRQRRLLEIEAENQKLKDAAESAKMRTAAGEPAAPARPAAAAPEEMPPAEAEVLEFTKSVGPERWLMFDRWFDDEDLPEGYKPGSGRRLVLASLARDLVKFTRGKREADRTAVRDEVLAEVAKRYDPRLKVAEEPGLERKQLLTAAKLFYDFDVKSIDDGTGEPLFPELGDLEASKEIARIWSDRGRKLTDEAVENAIWRFRSEHPEWVPAVEADDAVDDGSSSAAPADTTSRPARTRPRQRGALSGTGVPGHGLPSKSEPDDGLGVEDVAAVAKAKADREWGFNTRRRSA